MAVDECLRQILSSSNFLKFENVPYFVTAPHLGFSLFSLVELAEALGVSEELSKMFLIDNAHLVEVIFEVSDSNAQKNIRALVPEYYTTDALGGFLESASRGGVFHIEYRKKFIRLSQQALAFLNTPQDLLLLSGINM